MRRATRLSGSSHLWGAQSFSFLRQGPCDVSLSSPPPPTPGPSTANLLEEGGAEQGRGPHVESHPLSGSHTSSPFSEVLPVRLRTRAGLAERPGRAPHGSAAL